MTVTYLRLRIAIMECERGKEYGQIALLRIFV